jgi:peptide/nickel transport system permease protein
MSDDAIVSEYVDEADLPYEIESDSVETPRTTWERIWHGLRSDKLALLGALIVLGFVLVAVFAPLVAPLDPDQTYEFMKPPLSSSVGNFDSDPATERAFHLLGTDAYGHDILSQIVYGSRVSLTVAFGTIAIAFTAGTTIGLLAGYYRGIVDTLLMRYIDFQWAFPELILAVGLIAFTGGTGLWNVVIAIGIAFIDDFARLVRGEVLSLRQEEYVTAAKSVGETDRRIMSREILPNAVAPIIVQATFMIPLAILAEASLSFLGLGLNPTTPTWGILISAGRNYLQQAWWISVMPGLAIMITVLGFNMFGDGLRDVFDISDTEVDRR